MSLVVDRLAPAAQRDATRVWAVLGRASLMSRLTWALIAALSLLVLTLAPLAGLAIAWRELWTIPALAIAIAIAAVLLRTQGWFPRIADGAEATAALSMLAFCVPLLTCVLATTALPLADARLIAMDAALGLDWRWLAGLAKDQEAVSLALSYAYASLMYQPALLVLALAFAGRARRLEGVTLAWAVALAVTAGAFPLAPALGGYLHYGLAPQDFPFIKVQAAWLHATVLEPLRNGTTSELGRLALEGIVTFPSFHTSAAVLLAWGFWGLRLLRWPALALNAAMIAACLFVGAHYIVDLIAGGAVAWGAILVAKRADRHTSIRRAELVWKPYVQ